jgi:hypothetical protein
VRRSTAARALLRHPALIPAAIREEALVLSDHDTAKRVHYV